MDCLEAEFNGSLVLAQTGSRQLFLLNPVAAFIWKARKAAISALEISELLSRQLSVPRAEIIGDVRHAIVDFDSMEARFQSKLCKPAVRHLGKSQSVLPESACCWTAHLRLAGRSILLRVQDSGMASVLKPILDHLVTNPASPATQITLAGTPGQWELDQDGFLCAPVDTHPIANVIHHLVETACCNEKQLLTVHGAGLSTLGQGILLVGAGGSGKTTLAAALNASGFDLMSDDVVPVTSDGQLLPVGMSLCLKQGSWDVLECCLPALKDQPTIERFGRQVRFVPPPGRITTSPQRTSLIIFPSYQANGESRVVKLDEKDILQGLIDSESLILNLDQDRLERLLTWVASAPGYRIEYPSLDSGTALVESLVRQHFP